MSSNPEEQAREAPLQAAAPLYVTIGPPCCGKTTWLTNAQVKDIALDDQPSVYIPIETPYFTTNEDRPKWMNRTIFGRSLSDRVQDGEQAELRLVLQRLQNYITVEQFQESLQTLPSKSSEYNTTIVPNLVTTVGKLVSKPLPKTIDLFIQQSIYRPNQRTNRTGLESAQMQLENTSVYQAVAWGNTNTRPSEYKVAMEIASRQGRPVHFVVYGEENEHVENEVLDMQVSYEDLLFRNLNRLLQKGRYVPATVIWEMRQRSLEFMQRTVHAWKRDQDKRANATSVEQTTESDDTQPKTEEEPMDLTLSSVEQTTESEATRSEAEVKPMTKMDFHRYLASAINFDMKEDRTVAARNITKHRKPRHNTTRAWNDNTGRGRDFRPWERGSRGRQEGERGRGSRPGQPYGGRSPNRWNGTFSTNRTLAGRGPFVQGRRPPADGTYDGRPSYRWSGRSSAYRSHGAPSSDRRYGRPPSRRRSGGPAAGRTQYVSPGQEPAADRLDGRSSPGRSGSPRPSSAYKADPPLKRTRPTDET